MVKLRPLAVNFEGGLDAVCDCGHRLGHHNVGDIRCMVQLVVTEVYSSLPGERREVSRERCTCTAFQAKKLWRGAGPYPY